MLRGIRWLAVALALLAAAQPDGGTTTMNQVKVERLGDVAPFRDTGSWIRSKAVEPTPIILWRGQEIAAAFYYQWKGNTLLSTYEQKIASMEKSPRTRLGPVFPLRFSGRVQKERGEEALPAFDVDHHQVADLNGDGVDELVLPHHLGSVEVYNLSGRVHSGAVPNTDPRHFSYEVVSAQKVRVGTKESVYFIFHRDPFKGTAPSPTGKTSPPDSILEVTDAGVRSIQITGLPAPLKQIVGLGLRNRPGSSQVDDLVLLSRWKDDEALYLSVHDMGGQLKGEARKVYGDVSGQHRFEFAFLPQSDLLAAAGDSSELVAFIWPDKPANWIRTVRFSPDLGGHPFFRGFVDRKSGSPKALVQFENKLYALNHEGAYCRREGGKYVEHAKPIPWAEIAPAGAKFRTAQVRLLEGDDDTVLVIDAREEGQRELDLKEAREAAAKFLPPKYVAENEEEYRPKFEELNDEKSVNYYVTKYRVTEPIKTLDDMQRLIPQYYNRKVASLESSLASQLESELLRPLTMDTPIAEPRYRNIPEYKAWLATTQLTPEVRIRTLPGGESTGIDRFLSNTGLLRLGPEPGIPRCWVAVGRHIDHHLRMVLPLVREEGSNITDGFFFVSMD